MFFICGINVHYSVSSIVDDMKIKLKHSKRIYIFVKVIVVVIWEIESVML